jgi:hypothetical protein
MLSDGSPLREKPPPAVAPVAAAAQSLVGGTIPEPALQKEIKFSSQRRVAFWEDGKENSFLLLAPGS